MHKSEFVHKDEVQKILRDFEIQVDYLISGRGPDLVTVNIKIESLLISGLNRSG